MLRDILVPLDGSRLAEHALPLAAGLARLAKARLHLVRVEEPTGVFAGMGELPLPLSRAAEGGQSAEAYLRQTAEELHRSYGCEVGSREVTGWAGPGICEEASRLDCDLVVMATHGRGGFKSAWLGSVADFAIRHLGVPVLLVPRLAHRRPRAAFRRILVALDFSGESETILKPAAELARLTGAELELIHVVEVILETGMARVAGPVLIGTELLDVARGDAEARLAGMAARLQGEGLRVSTRVALDAKASAGLLRALENPSCDLLALTSHGASGWRRMLLGSVATRMMQHASKPVLVWRPLSRQGGES